MNKTKPLVSAKKEEFESAECETAHTDKKTQNCKAVSFHSINA